MHGSMCVCIYIHIYKPVARCQTLEEQWQRAVMRRRSSATRNKEVVDVADATLSATTLLFGIFGVLRNSVHPCYCYAGKVNDLAEETWQNFIDRDHH